jgi:hypothetical protein
MTFVAAQHTHADLLPIQNENSMVRVGLIPVLMEIHFKAVLADPALKKRSSETAFRTKVTRKSGVPKGQLTRRGRSSGVGYIG